MAEKRMISKVISISKKFNLKLDDHFSRLAYLLLIPHADDFGRLTGDPFKIKALILPMMKDVDEDLVELTLEKLHNAELINWYEVDGEQYIQINNFDEHQQGLHKRTKSKFPDPPDSSGKFPEIPPELNRTEQKGKATATREDISQPEESEAFPAAYVRVNQRDLTPFQVEQLGAYIDDEGFEEPVIIRAIERAAIAGGGIKLVIKILNDYAAGGAKTLKGAEAYDAEFESRKIRGDPKPQDKAANFAKLARELEHDEIRSGQTV